MMKFTRLYEPNNEIGIPRQHLSVTGLELGKCELQGFTSLEKLLVFFCGDFDLYD